MNENDKLKEKLDLLSALKEDEEREKNKEKSNDKKEENKKKKEIEEKKKKEVLNEIKKVKEMTPKHKNYLFTFASFICLVISLTYLIYNIVKETNQINQPYLIINSGCLLFLSVLFVLIGFTTNKKMNKKLNTMSITFTGLYIVFQFLVSSQIVLLPTLKTVGDFSNTSINEVIKWANENKITLEQIYEYSDLIQSDYVISQNIPANTLIKEVNKIEVIVSNGPNYEAIASIPNMIGWHVDDVIKKIKELKLNNVTIEYNFNEAIDKDIIYEQSKSGEIRRNEELVLKFSLGKEADLKPVNLINLTGKEEFDAILWLKRNGIRFEISYEFNNDIESGKVVSITPSEGTLINQKETTIQIVISKGSKITAPDLMKMSLDEITEWAIQNKLVLVYDSEYNSDIKAGDIIRVSVKEGDTLEENARIYIITSRGTLKMIAYTDGDITALRNFAAENNITLTEIEEFNDTVPKGNFINISKKTGDVINAGEEIKITISLGSSIEIPSFIGANANTAKTNCTNLGLACTLSYVYSSKTKGTVINQSMSAGSKVIGGTTIVLTVSNGPKPSNNEKPPVVEPPTPSCTEKNLGSLIIQESWLSIGSAEKTIASLNSQLSKAYPGATFHIVAVDYSGDMTSGLIHPNTPVNAGTPIKSCHTYTIYIVK